MSLSMKENQRSAFIVVMNGYDILEVMILEGD